MIKKGNRVEDIYEKILLAWGYIFFSPILLVWWLIRRFPKVRKAFISIYGLFNYYDKKNTR